MILVHVSGAVNKEGIYELKENSRISDAIEKAGGLKEEADIQDINLAYKLEDGMKIHIPTKQEKEDAKEKNSDISSSSGIKVDKEDSIQNDSKDKGGSNGLNTKVNINTATQAELETLPGIGSSTAMKIIQYRNEKGKFKKIDEVKEVSGMGKSKYEKIKNYINV